MQTWTLGPGGAYTATWNGSTLTVTVTASGAAVASVSGQEVATLAGAQAVAAGILAQATNGLSGVLTAYQQASAGVTPSATANTFGAPQTLGPLAGFSGFLPTNVFYVSTGLASESVVLEATVTYSDGTQATNQLVTITTNVTASFTTTNLATMLGSVNGKQVKSIAFAVKSTIASSAASVTVTLIGLNLP